MGEMRRRFEIYKKGQGTASRVASAACLALFLIFGCVALRGELTTLDLSAAVTVAGQEVPLVLLISGILFAVVGVALGLAARLAAGIVAGGAALLIIGHAAVYYLRLSPGDAIVGSVFLLGAAGIAYLINAPGAVDFLMATEAELRKVSWPTWPDLRRQTFVVIATVAIFAALILIADLIVSRVIILIRGL